MSDALMQDAASDPRVKEAVSASAQDAAADPRVREAVFNAAQAAAKDPELTAQLQNDAASAFVKHVPPASKKSIKVVESKLEEALADPLAKSQPEEPAKPLAEQASQQMQDLEEILTKYPILNTLHEKSGVARSHLVIICLIGYHFFLYIAFGSDALVNFIGTAYPIFASFKATKSDCPEDDSQWLTYWVVFGFFILIESFTNFLFDWVPGYYAVKAAFLMWCFLPHFRGASLIYHKGIEPFLSKYEDRIDKNIHEVKANSASLVRHAVSEASSLAVRGAVAVISRKMKSDVDAMSNPPADQASNKRA